MDGVVRTPTRRLLGWELAAVLLVGLGASGLRSILSLIRGLLAEASLAQQTVTLNAPQSPIVWLDASFQLVASAALFAQGGLVLYLLTLSPAPDLPQPLQHLRRELRAWRSYAWAAGIAAGIGIPGIGLYLLAYRLELARLVIPSGLDETVLHTALLILNALGNGVAEELVMVWLISRLMQLGMGGSSAIVLAAGLRGSYHLYQGFGGGLGNLLMGLLFGVLYRRYGLIWPLVIAHWIMDVAVFIGYAAIAPLLGLPGT